jgi:hypothetical protein
MEFLPGERGPRPGDIVNEQGWIVERHDNLRMPTIERERFLATGNFVDRRPTPETALQTDTPGRPDAHSDRPPKTFAC